MRCDVLAVGTELLLGDIVNTNAADIGRELAAIGVDSYRHVVIGDNRDRIAQTIRELLASADALIITGGLGPTHDDITRDAVADVAGTDLVRDQDTYDYIKSFFAARNRDMPENNLRQAEFPRGAVIYPSSPGTARGFRCDISGKPVFVLPGVPAEMRQLLSDQVLNELQRYRGEPWVIVSRAVRTWGIGESTVGEQLSGLIADYEREQRVTLALLADEIRGVTVRLTVKAPTIDEAQVLLTAEQQRVTDVLGDGIYGVDDDTLESVVAAQAVAQRKTIGVAESLTGGLLSARFVNVPGASVWFRGGVVSYASDVKFSVLDVPEGPVVSADAAMAMARGAREVLKTDIGLSITGVAGPTDQDGQPVGTVFVGVAIGDEVLAEEGYFAGTRDNVRNRAASFALDVLRRVLG